MDNGGSGDQAVGKRKQHLLAEQRHDLAEQPASQRRTRDKQLVGINAEVADVVLEPAQSDRRILKKVALSKLKESAAGLEDVAAAPQRLARKGIQDDIDALALCYGEDLIGECQAA